MAEENKQNEESSMEEILHSIRDIIAEGSVNEAKEQQSEASNADDEEILDLTQTVEDKPAADDMAGLELVEAKDVLENIDETLAVPAKTPEPELEPEPEAKPAVAEPLQEPTTAAAPPPVASQDTWDELPDEEPEEEIKIEKPKKVAKKSKSESLLSDDAARLSSEAIKELMEKIPSPKIESPTFRSGSTVEELVVESMKPMLALWLEKNLPTIVQELVKKEIKKIIPRD